MSSPRSKETAAGTRGPPEEEAAFESLVSGHYAFIWRLLRGMGLSASDAEDAAQEVFVIASRKLKSIAQGRERSFLYGTTLRVASNARRGVRRRRELVTEPEDSPESESRGPERLTELERARALLSELVGQLPEKLRRVFLLAEIGGLEIAEIAVLEEIPAGTSASRLRLAREQFRALVEGNRHRNPFSEDP